MTPRKFRPNSTPKRVRTAVVADLQAPEEAQSKIQLGVRIAETTHQQFKLASVISGIDMQILVEKSLLERDTVDGSHVYRPRIEREQTQREMAEHLMNRAFGGSAYQLLLGALSVAVTTGLLGVFGMGKGGDFNRRNSNKLMRMRVIFQGLAIASFVLHAVRHVVPHETLAMGRLLVDTDDAVTSLL